MPKGRFKTQYPGVYTRPKSCIGRSGKERVYYIRYRRGGRDSQLIEEVVGKESEGMTPAKANRARIDRITGKALSNAEARAEQQAAKLAANGRMTVNNLWEAYKEAHPEHRGMDQSRYDTHLKDAFGRMYPDEISTNDVGKLRVRLFKAQKAPATIQRVLVLLRAILNFGVQNGLCRPLDPQKLVFKVIKVDNLKTEVWTDEQLVRLLSALDQERDQDAAALIRLAMVTGMRKGALLALRWDDCDFTREIITLRGEAAKKGKTEHIPMSAAARQVLERIQRTDSAFVFPGRGGKRRADYRCIARRVKKRAELPDDFRLLHGLRHNYASRLASSGEVDMYTLQKLLTHETPAMTQRYAHLHDSAMKRAACVADVVLRPKSAA